MRIREKALHHYPFFVRPFFWRQRQKYGQVLKPGLLWGRSPWLFAAVAILYGVLDRRKSPLNPVLRSLVTVRVSQINWCAFCVDINSNTLLQRAGVQDKVDALDHWQSADCYSHAERLALEYTEAVTRSDIQVTDDLMTRLKQAYHDDHIIELTGLIAFQNLSSKFNAALDVPAQGFCRLPKEK